MANSSVDIFVQIGLVVLVGLACKNSILIVEFARRLPHRGQARYEATKEASRLRLRPILMTSFAFILGVVPLLVATGAGSEMRRSLGTAVFSGMLGVTAFGIFLTPVFFYVIHGLSETHLFRAIATQWIGSCLMARCWGAASASRSRGSGWSIRCGGWRSAAAPASWPALVLQTVHWHVGNGARKKNGEAKKPARNESRTNGVNRHLSASRQFVILSAAKDLAYVGIRPRFFAALRMTALGSPATAVAGRLLRANRQFLTTDH